MIDPTLPKRLHDLYVTLTGFEIRWGVDRLYPWELFALRFGEDDLRLVIKWIKGRHATGKPARSLTFRSLISGPGSLDYFEEDLCQAKAELRTRKQQGDPNRRAVLAATGRPAADRPARSAAEIAAGMREFEKFKALKESL